MTLRAFLCLVLVFAALLFAQTQTPVFSVAPSMPGDTLQYAPATAYSKAADIWLVVWANGLINNVDSGAGQDIYGARIKGDGTLLDPTGFLICNAADYQSAPVVSSNGTDFMVFWQDMRSGKDWDVYAARVNSAGQVLDANGFLVSGGDHNQCLPKAVFAGENYFVVWSDARNFPEYRCIGTRIASSGQILDASGTEIIRFMSDADVTGVTNTNFSPDVKYNNGWLQYLKPMDNVTLTAHQNVILVAAYLQGYGADNGKPGSQGVSDFYWRAVSIGTGLPVGSLIKSGYKNLLDSYWTTYPSDHPISAASTLTPITSGQLGLVPLDSTNGFLTCMNVRANGFGPAMCGVVVSGLLDSLGKLVKSPRINSIYPDTFNTYRSLGAPPISMNVARAGSASLMVFDQHLQTNSVRQQGIMNILGCFFDSTGSIIDTVPLAIGETGRVKCVPHVSGGADGRFLVVWQEEGLGANTAVRVRGSIITKQ